MQSKVYGPILKIGKCLTSNGVLVDANIVNPTMSQKRMLTSSNSSAWTDVNNLSWSATGLNREKNVMIWVEDSVINLQYVIPEEL